jgi:type IV pilus modification protein PilV
MKPGNTHKAQKNSAGFTLIEVLISTFVLTIGFLSLLSVFGLAMAGTLTAQEDRIAKQLAQDAYESIYTARDTANVPWANIENVGTGTGIFVAGFQPIYKAGADGIIGTADDAAAGPQQFQLAGPDGIFGTADDITVPLTNFQRSIVITDVTNGGTTVVNLKTITVTVQYTTPQTRFAKQYTLSGYVSQYR